MQPWVPTARIGLGGFFAEVAATWRSSRRPSVCAAAAIMCGGEIAITYASYVNQFSPAAIAYGWLIKPLHALFSILVMVAFYRAILARHGNIWRVDGSTFRFVGGAVIELGLAIAAVVLARLWMSAMLAALGVGGTAAAVAQTCGVTIIAILVTIAFLRTQPWLAALAVNRRDVTLQSSWTETAGMNWVLIASWAMTALPLMMAQAATDLLAIQLAPVGVAHVVLAVAAGLLIACIALATTLLNSAIFRLIAGAEPAGCRTAVCAGRQSQAEPR